MRSNPILKTINYLIFYSNSHSVLLPLHKRPGENITNELTFFSFSLYPHSMHKQHPVFTAHSVLDSTVLMAVHRSVDHLLVSAELKCKLLHSAKPASLKLSAYSLPKLHHDSTNYRLDTWFIHHKSKILVAITLINMAKILVPV